MYRHIVMWKFKDPTQENLDKVKNGLLSLVPIIPEVRKMEIYKDSAHTPASYDLLLYTEFENEKDCAFYADHPEHVKVKRIIGELTSDRVVLDSDE